MKGFKKGQLVRCTLTSDEPLAIIVQGGTRAAKILWVEPGMTSKPQWISAEYLKVVS
jgi:hypothetical protein